MSNTKAIRSLQRKLSLRLSFAMGAFIVGVFLILRAIITPAFEELELSAAHTDLIRAEQAIQTDIENLAAVTLDWAPWDDIYEYVSGRNPGFEKSNLIRPTLTNLNIDMIAVYEMGSQLKWGQMLVDGEERPLSDLGILSPTDAAFELLTRHDSPNGGVIGIVNTSLGPLLVSSQPILRSDYSGTVAGAVIMGQFLNESRLARLRERTEVDMTWMLVETYVVEGQRELSDIPLGELPVRLSDEAVTNCVVLADILGLPYLLVSSKTPREITWLGQQTINAALLFLAVAGLSFAIVLWWFMKGTVIDPIERLMGHMGKIRKSGDLSDNLNLDSDDEIGLLAEEYNKLNSEVHETRAALLHQSFKAGKADTAAEVLHNIRNAMTPLINGLDRLGKAHNVTDGLHFSEAIEKLADPDCDPQLAGKYLQYLGASFDRIAAVNGEAHDDLKIIASQAHQIVGILSDQEKFTNVAPVAENLVVDEMMEEAAHVLPKDSPTEIDVDVDKDLTKYRVRAHRTGLLQVLSNLILNAHESIQRSNAADGRISLSASDTVINDQKMVQLTVRDNGTGFDEEVRNKIFQRGFTSKSQGDFTGLGLHWCANAVASMGGRIFADSQGEGHGAEFHVLLPAAQGG